MTRTQFSCGIKKNHTLTLNLGKVAAQQPRLLPLERKSSRKLNKVFRQRFPAQAKKKESGWIYMGNSAYAEITINYNYKKFISWYTL